MNKPKLTSIALWLLELAIIGVIIYFILNL